MMFFRLFNALFSSLGSSTQEAKKKQESINEFLKKEEIKALTEKEFNLIKEEIVNQKEKGFDFCRYSLCYNSDPEKLMKELKDLNYFVIYYVKKGKAVLFINYKTILVDAEIASHSSDCFHKDVARSYLEDIYRRILDESKLGKYSMYYCLNDENYCKLIIQELRLKKYTADLIDRGISITWESGIVFK